MPHLLLYREELSSAVEQEIVFLSENSVVAQTKNDGNTLRITKNRGLHQSNQNKDFVNRKRNVTVETERNQSIKNTWYELE